MSKALKARNRVVDPKRNIIPISGTKIRENPYKYREFLDPVVYRDLITNVVYLGAPSTGKTTIARRMAEEYNTVWKPEYGREYWEKYQVHRRLSGEQLVEIARIHLEKEEKKLLTANKYLFTDTNAITTYVFSKYYHNKAKRQLEEYAKRAESRYDLIFLCDLDIPYEDTWDRSGEVNRYYFQNRVIADLKLRKIPYFTLQGNLEERVSYVKRVLRSYSKFMNPYEHYHHLITERN